jgi:hypothetical protein
MPKGGSSGWGSSRTRIQGLGASLTQESPATLGAITFNGDGTKCIGLLRRGACR